MAQVHDGQVHDGQIVATGFGATAPTLSVVDRAQTSLVLATSAYSGPGTHANTLLEGRLDGAADWETLVWDELKTSGDLTLLSVTGLTASTDYEFRARHGSSNGTESEFSVTLDVRTKGALAEFTQTNLLWVLATPIAGETENSIPSPWPDTGPLADIGLPSVGDPRYRTDGPCTGLDVVEFDGTDYYEDSVAGPSAIPNRMRDNPGDLTFICAVRHTGGSNGTIFGVFTFGGDNIWLCQTLASPSRFRVLGPGVDLILGYTPVGGGDLDVFCVTYNHTTRLVRCWHFNEFLGEDTFSSQIAFANIHWAEIGNDLDPGGPSEVFMGDMSLAGAYWAEELGDGEREDNTDFAADGYTCAGSGGGGGGGCVPPTVSFERNVIAAGGPRVDIILLGTPPANHTQSRYRIKRDSDDEIVYPAGDTWVTSSVDLLGHTASDPDIPVGVLLYAEAEWFDGDAMTWCGVGTSGTFTIENVQTRAERNFATVTVRETASAR